MHPTNTPNYTLPLSAITGDEIRMGISTIESLRRALEAPTGAPSPVLSFLGLREHLRTLAATTGENGSDGGVLAAGNAVLPAALAHVDIPVVERLGGNMRRVPRGTGKVTQPTMGEFTAAWLGEVEAAPESSPGFAGRPLVANRLGLFAEISVQLTKQAPDLADQVSAGIVRAINTAIDRAAIRGLGTEHQPLGVLLTPGITSVDCHEAPPTADQIEAAEEVVRDLSPGSEAFAWLLSTRAARAFRRAGLFDQDKRHVNGIRVVVSGQAPTIAGVAVDKVGSAVLARWSDLTVCIWDTITVQLNPYIKDAEGKIRIYGEAFADCEVVRPESFVKLINIALPQE